MKLVKIILGIVIGISSLQLSGQSFRETFYADRSDGEREFSNGRDVMFGVQRSMHNFKDDNISKKVEKALVDQAVLNNWIAMNRAKSLADHGNHKLYFAQKSEKRQIARYYSLEQTLADKEDILAEKWRNSRTGMLDGREWYDLSEEEKEIYRIRYIKFQNPSLRIEADFNMYSGRRMNIPQSEYEYAWNVQNLGNPKSQSWDKLNFRTKNKFRKSYHDYKLAKHSPKTEIGEDEFAVAWEIAQIGSSNLVSWDEMNDRKLKESFRKQYQFMKSNANFRAPNHFLNKSNQVDTTLAVLD